MVYDEPMTYVGFPDKEGNVEVITLLCPTAFMLYKTNPDFTPGTLYEITKVYCTND